MASQSETNVVRLAVFAILLFSFTYWLTADRRRPADPSTYGPHKPRAAPQQDTPVVAQHPAATAEAPAGRPMPMPTRDAPVTVAGKAPPVSQDGTINTVYGKTDQVVQLEAPAEADGRLQIHAPHKPAARYTKEQVLAAVERSLWTEPSAEWLSEMVTMLEERALDPDAVWLPAREGYEKRSLHRDPRLDFARELRRRCHDAPITADSSSAIQSWLQQQYQSVLSFVQTVRVSVLGRHLKHGKLVAEAFQRKYAESGLEAQLNGYTVDGELVFSLYWVYRFQGLLCTPLAGDYSGKCTCDADLLQRHTNWLPKD